MGLGLRSWQFFSRLLMPKRSQQKVVYRKCVGASLSRSFHFFSLSTDCTSLRVLSLRTESWSVPQHVQHFPPHSWWAKSGREKQWCRIRKMEKQTQLWMQNGETRKWQFHWFFKILEDAPKKRLETASWKPPPNSQDVSLNVPGEPVQQGTRDCCCGMRICPTTHLEQKKTHLKDTGKLSGLRASVTSLEKERWGQEYGSILPYTMRSM